MNADCLAALVVPDDCTSTEEALVEQIVLADAAAAAAAAAALDEAMESLAELAAILTRTGGYLRHEQQRQLAHAKRLLAIYRGEVAQ